MSVVKGAQTNVRTYAGSCLSPRAALRPGQVLSRIWGARRGDALSAQVVGLARRPASLAPVLGPCVSRTGPCAGRGAARFGCPRRGLRHSAALTRGLQHTIAVCSEAATMPTPCQTQDPTHRVEAGIASVEGHGLSPSTCRLASP